MLLKEIVIYIRYIYIIRDSILTLILIYKDISLAAYFYDFNFSELAANLQVSNHFLSPRAIATVDDRFRNIASDRNAQSCRKLTV